MNLDPQAEVRSSQVCPYCQCDAQGAHAVSPASINGVSAVAMQPESNINNCNGNLGSFNTTFNLYLPGSSTSTSVAATEGREIPTVLDILERPSIEKNLRVHTIRESIESQDKPSAGVNDETMRMPAKTNSHETIGSKENRPLRNSTCQECKKRTAPGLSHISHLQNLDRVYHESTESDSKHGRLALTTIKESTNTKSQAFRENGRETQSLLVRFVGSVKSCFSPHRTVNQRQNAVVPRRYPFLKRERVKKYLPNAMSEEITRFMCTGHLGNANVIPLWNPSSSVRKGRRPRLRCIDVGDVGVINAHGGFHVVFNVLLDGVTNISCGYEPLPPNFSKFVPSGVPKKDTWDVNEVIDVKGCGAIDHNNIRSIEEYFTYGFDNTTQDKEKRELLHSVSPNPGGKDHAIVYLPDGADKLNLFPTKTFDLRHYVHAQMPSWQEFLENLQDSTGSRPLLLTAVWVAKRFACATYVSNRKSKSISHASLYRESGDKIKWTSPDGFVTIVEPVGGGDMGDLCFGIEGLELSLQKKPEKS